MIQNNSNLFDVKDIILDFKLNIISSKISKTTHYNSYQQKLYDQPIIEIFDDGSVEKKLIIEK